MWGRASAARQPRRCHQKARQSFCSPGTAAGSAATARGISLLPEPCTRGAGRVQRPRSCSPPLSSLPPSRRSNLWTPTSQRGVDFSNTAEAPVIYAGQGPPPPSPLVVERFQQVISQLFQQVRSSTRAAACWPQPARISQPSPGCRAPGVEEGCPLVLVARVLPGCDHGGQPGRATRPSCGGAHGWVVCRAPPRTEHELVPNLWSLAQPSFPPHSLALFWRSPVRPGCLAKC